MPAHSTAAIIDIGSNSVRLVVYAGTPRIPVPIFNEKLMAGLGEGLAESGRIGEAHMERALAALHRFKLLLDHMKVDKTRVLATAAVRDAANGREFVRAVARIGLKTDVIPAEQEATLAGEGVLSAIPEADGIVGDLGGGSLELVHVEGGRTRCGFSLPLGVLRIREEADAERYVRQVLRSALRENGLRDKAEGKCFYMVGGSWRALARMDMIDSGFPLPVTHQYAIAPDRLRQLRRIARQPPAALAGGISPMRLAAAPAAAMLLGELADQLRPRRLVASTFGIREGLLYSALRPAERRKDPLIEAARDAGGGEHRFGQHGDTLDRWIAPVFDDPPAMQRLRLAACLLADIAWQAAPPFRAERGVEMALHGNWVAIDPRGRVIVAQALSSNFGRDRLADQAVERLCGPADLARAHQWGLAMRLGQRLCGGVGSALGAARLECAGGELRLVMKRGQEALAGDAVRRRLQRLAQALGCTPAVVAAA